MKLASQPQAALAMFPGRRFATAMAAVLKGVEEDFGPVGTDQVQLCPQNAGTITDAVIDELQAMAPHTRYRLHANVRLPRGSRKGAEASAALDPDRQDYFECLAATSSALAAPAYSLHAGLRANGDLNHLRECMAHLQSLFDCPVAVEGHYPTRDNKWLVSSWQEYRWLLESGLDYALDLSHLNVVAWGERRVEWSLTAELMASEHCIEIHTSGNDGRGDHHLPLTGIGEPWWSELLADYQGQAVIFTEGVQTRGETMQTRLESGVRPLPAEWIVA